MITANKGKLGTPTRYEELPYRKFQKVCMITDPIERLAILMDIEPEKMKQAKIPGLFAFIKAATFLDTDPVINDNPKKLGEFTLPADATLESVEQFQMAKDAIDKTNWDEPAQEWELLLRLSAIYSMAEFDAGKLQAHEEVISNLPCEEVMSAGRFFLLTYWSTVRNIPLGSLQEAIRTKNYQQVWKLSTKNLASTESSTPSPATRGKKKKTSSKRGAPGSSSSRSSSSRGGTTRKRN